MSRDNERCICPITDFEWCPVHSNPQRDSEPSGPSNEARYRAALERIARGLDLPGDMIFGAREALKPVKPKPASDEGRERPDLKALAVEWGERSSFKPPKPASDEEGKC